MTSEQYFDAIKCGHFLYWDMLGNLRGMKNHKEDNLRWLTGDIDFTYFTEAAQIDDVVKRMKEGVLPKNLFFVLNDSNKDMSDLFLSSGLFRKTMETVGMAHDLCDIMLPVPDRCIELFRVREISQLKMTGAILNTVFEYNLFSFERFVEMLENDRQFFYLAEYDGLPVGAVMAQHGDSFVNISWAGTLPGYRNLGIAGHLINMAERDGLQHNKAVGVLHAYPEAVGAYRRIGYMGFSHGIGIELCC